MIRSDAGAHSGTAGAERSTSRCLSLRQVCELTALCERTVRSYISAGELLATRFGRAVRVREIDLEAFVLAHREAPQEVATPSRRRGS
jgi:excisionase family DNA binding protein